MQLKDPIAFTYENPLIAGVPTKANWTAAKVVETQNPLGEDVEDEDDGAVSERGNYFFSSEVPVE